MILPLFAQIRLSVFAGIESGDFQRGRGRRRRHHSPFFPFHVYIYFPFELKKSVKLKKGFYS